MVQIFDCASIIGRRLLSHDASATLLVSQLRQTNIDLYRLPTKSFLNPGKESAREGCACDDGCKEVYAIPAA